MAFVLTEEEKQLVAEGKLDPGQIEEHRKIHPIRSIDLNEVDKVKEEIKETNIKYREAINKNKELYDTLVNNRKEKEEVRNKLAELRLKKKKLLGLTQ
ncbi:MAG: hypothetical protein ABIJ08_06270 [Nanoarchaeota archaeon]